jgi:hypothetical protein
VSTVNELIHGRISYYELVLVLVIRISVVGVHILSASFTVEVPGDKLHTESDDNIQQVTGGLLR